MNPQYQFYQSSLGNDSYTNSWPKQHIGPKSPQLNTPSRLPIENLGIESPDMIPRNLLDGLTPALSPQMQPSNDLPPINLSLPPTSSGRGAYEYSMGSNSDSMSYLYAGSGSMKVEAGKNYLLPVHMKTGDVMREEPLEDSTDSFRTSDHGQKPADANQRRNEAPSADKSPQNPLLDDFHNRMTSRWSLLDLRGNVYEFSKDQDGSRFIQRQMEVAPEEAKFMIVQELITHANQLTKDVFGNYVIQKALEFGTVDQRISIVEKLLGNIPELTLHTYACRVVQKALEYIKHGLRLEIAKELHDVTLTCIYDQNGNHVLQKCIEVIPDNVDFIVSALKGNIWGVACHAYGCRVMQRLLEQSPIALRHADDLLQEIFSHSKELTRNQYGNYVVQHLLISSGSKYRDAIVDIVLPDFFELACHKFASNVIEKVIVFSENENHSRLMKKCFAEKDSDGVLCLVKLVTNPFGNYVVQRLFEFGSKEEKVKIASLLAAHMPLIERNSCSRHILPFILANAKALHDKGSEAKPSKGFSEQLERRAGSQATGHADLRNLKSSMDNLSLRDVHADVYPRAPKGAPSHTVRANHLPPTPTMPYAAAVQKSFKTESTPHVRKAEVVERKGAPKIASQCKSSIRRNGSS